jgi:hypothetical protein
MKLIKLGLCAGRHDIPNIDGYVFGEITDPTDIRTMNHQACKVLFGKFGLAQGDHIDLYVTGLTVALVEVLRVCLWEGITVTLWHYDRGTNSYFPQVFNQMNGGLYLYLSKARNEKI